MNEVLQAPQRLNRTLQRWLAAATTACMLWAAPAGAAVVISQVYGGGGNAGATLKQDFIELFNNGAADVNIGGWSVQYASSAGNSWAATVLPPGTTIGAGRYFLVQQAAGAGGTVAVVGDAIGTINMGGTAGKVVLSNLSDRFTVAVPSGAAVVDSVSYGTASTALEGSPAPTLSNTTAAIRAAAGCTDTNSNSADFSAGTPNPRSSTTTAVVCSGSGNGNGNGDANNNPPPTRAAIYAIQGSGGTSPLNTQRVVATGVITRLTNNGFFMQDLVGDNDPATSDGIFVFTGSTAYPAVVVGNQVDVTGTVTEFNVGAAANAATAANRVTELATVTSVTLLGTGLSITPVTVNLPVASVGALERYEGMLVTLSGPLVVSQNFFLARFGQLTLAAGGRLETPTNRYPAGSAQALALADLNARSRILLDDGSTGQNPDPTPYAGSNGVPRAGDTVGSITGVIDYGLATADNTGAGDYKIHPTVAPSFSIANPRTSAPEPVGGNLRVGSFNVLNFFTTFTNGNTAGGQSGQGCLLGGASAASNCRGANNLEEFLRQRSKIVEAMTALDADVLGLMEMQNNGNTAVQNLVDALNAKVGAGTYATVALPAAGTGTDAIRVAMIYKPARLSTVGAPLSDTDPVNNRPTLAQTFSLSNGERFSLVVNHLKSKGSCPEAGDPAIAGNADIGDGQGCWNEQRRQQAQRLRAFVAQVQAAAGSADVLLVGDFNAYGQEDPILVLTSNGYVDQIGRFNSFGYSYVFDGAAGRLDHAITTSSLSAKVARAIEWHINADESSAQDYNLEFKKPACAACGADPYTATPYRASDHDPVLVGLNLYKTVAGTAGRDVLQGSAGDDILVGGAGADVLSGGAGRNIFYYASMRDAGDLITDFVPGKDRIDLSALLASLGQDANSAYSRGVVRLVAAGSDTLLQIDTDGSAGPVVARTLLTLQGVSPAALQLQRDLGVQ